MVRDTKYIFTGNVSTRIVMQPMNHCTTLLLLVTLTTVFGTPVDSAGPGQQRYRIAPAPSTVQTQLPPAKVSVPFVKFLLLIPAGILMVSAAAISLVHLVSRPAKSGLPSGLADLRDETETRQSPNEDAVSHPKNG